MDNKYLFSNEQVILQSEDDIVTFTNYRLQYIDSEFGRAHIMSILLEKISSIEIHYRSKTIYLLLAIITVIGGFIGGTSENNESLIFIGFVVGVFFTIMYLLSRKHILTILSDGGGKINFYTKRMKQDQVLYFVNKLEAAIKQRREELR